MAVGGTSTRFSVGDLIALLGVLATIAMGLVAAKVAYDVWAQGSIPPKRLEVNTFGVQKPLDDLPEDGGDLSVQIKTKSGVVQRIWSVQTLVSNKGKTPILPADIFEPLRISVDKPWEIVTVANSSLFKRAFLSPSWQKVDNQNFVTKPALLNPGDTIGATVYLTVPDSTVMSDDAKPDVRWTARISNLRAIVPAQDVLEPEKVSGPPIKVDHEGWGLVFLVLFFVVTSLYTTLILVQGSSVRTIGVTSVIIVVAALLNLCAAESLATYLVPTSIQKLFGINHWMNAPPILVEAIMLFFVRRL